MRAVVVRGGLAATLVLAGLSVATAHAAPVHAWTQPVGGAFRSSELTNGEWVWTNGVWQAQGANTDGLHREDYFAALNPLGDQPTHIPRDIYKAFSYDFFGLHRSTHNGDYQLPTDSKKWPAGTGEISEIRLAADSHNLYVRLLWNSLPSADAQIATLTFDSARPRGAITALNTWPANAKLRSAFQTAATFSSQGVALASVGSAPLVSHIPTSIDLKAHTTSAVIPLSALPAGPWTLNGGSGLANPSDPSRYWDVPAGTASTTSPGSGFATSPTNVWGLLFAGDSPWSFDEKAQADELNKGLSTSTVVVDPAALKRHATAAPAARTGDFSVLFRSRYDGGDGISITRDGVAPVGLDQLPISYPAHTTGFNETWDYTGRLQEYAMHVPASYSSRATPLVVYLHGFTGQPDEPFQNPVGLVKAIDKRGWLLASALGRGDEYYKGIGDLDIQELIADVSKRYHVDPNRIYLMGHSMGGYGTDNVATRHPDEFAAIAPAEGTASPDLALNLRNVPFFVTTALEDIDTGGKQADAFYKILSDAGFNATELKYLMKTHEYSSIYDDLPRLLDFFAAHVRNPSPALVTYIKAPGEEMDSLGLSYAGAYWVSGLKASAVSMHSQIDAESFAIPHVTKAVQQGAAVRTSGTDVAPGPTGRTVAVLSHTQPGIGALAPIARRIELTATNLRTASIDLDRAGILSNGISMRLIVHASNPMTIVLTNSGTSRVIRVGPGTTSLKLIP